jgi:proteasome alpha subunit
MRDEPYRWIEAIRDRRDYIEDQLSQGSPVVGLSYDDGMLLLTVGRGQRKIFEVHNRIAMSAMGRAADIARLRELITDHASIQGFQHSVDDVTLHRMTNFVLAPVITQAFEAIFESAYILKMLLVELGTKGSEKQFISMNYDGSVRSSPRTEVIGGTEAIETGMKNHLSASDSENRSLESAVRLALETWAIGRDLSLQADDLSEEDEQGNESHLNEDQLRDVLKRELEDGQIEVGVLDTSRRSNSKFRLLHSTEIESAIADWL